MSYKQIKNKLNEIQRESGPFIALRKSLRLLETLSVKEQFLFCLDTLNLKKVPPVFSVVGTPGAGKSTFLNSYASYVKKNQQKLGFILMDPGHPEHSGSILGDRIRLSEHFLGDNIFIRSLSSRNSEMGVNPFIEFYIMLYLYAPFDGIFVEFIGSGQVENRFKGLCHNVFLIFDPYSGDSVQHLKSGVLDSVDRIIISKADLYSNPNIKNSLIESISRNIPVDFVNLTDQKQMEEIFASIKVQKNYTSELFVRYYLKKFINTELEKISLELLNNIGDVDRVLSDGPKKLIEKIHKIK